MTGGWVLGTSDYNLPAYIRGDIQPQQKRYTNSLVDEENNYQQWVDVLAFHTWPNADGGLTLHWDTAPDTGDGRIVWWGRNGRLPVSVPILTADIDTDDTSCIISTAEDLPEAGYIRIDNEYIGYAGVTDTAFDQKVLTNLQRNVRNGTLVTGSHVTNDPVEFCVAVHRDDLFMQLYDATQSRLHELFLIAAAESERAHHERMAMWYDDKATNFWRGYVPNKPWRLKLDRRTTGTRQRQTLIEVTI